MAAGLNLNSLLFIAIMVASMQFHQTVGQINHIVGGSEGWGLPSRGAALYTDWALSQNFNGDTLQFDLVDLYEDNVYEVNADQFGNCMSDATSIGHTVNDDGQVIVSLKHTDSYYFICTTQDRCENGQKLTVKVTNGSTEPSPAAAAPPPPPVMDPRPPRASGAQPFTATVAATFVSIGLAIFNY